MSHVLFVAYIYRLESKHSSACAGLAKDYKVVCFKFIDMLPHTYTSIDSNTQVKKKTKKNFPLTAREIKLSVLNRVQCQFYTEAIYFRSDIFKVRPK